MGENSELLPVSALDSFEGRCEDWFDGLRRLLRAPVEPVTIQRRIAQQMRAHAQIHPGRLVAPNRYRVRLSLRDFAFFAARIGSLEREFAEGLADEARRSALAFLSPPLVEMAADPDVPEGRLRVECALAEAGREPNLWWRSHPPDARKPHASFRTRRAIRLVRAVPPPPRRRPHIRAVPLTAPQAQAVRSPATGARRARGLPKALSRILLAVVVVYLMVLGPCRAAADSVVDAVSARVGSR